MLPSTFTDTWMEVTSSRVQQLAPDCCMTEREFASLKIDLDPGYKPTTYQFDIIPFIHIAIFNCFSIEVIIGDHCT